LPSPPLIVPMVMVFTGSSNIKQLLYIVVSPSEREVKYDFRQG
jgi:hypothetical protein